MNILFLSQYLYPCHIGGVEIFNYHLIQALSKKHRIWALTTCPGAFGGQDIRVLPFDPKKYGSRKISLLSAHVRNIIRLRKVIDVIHLPYTSREWLPGCYLPLFRKTLGLPYIMVLHGGGMLPWKPRLPHQLLFREAAAIIAVSETIRMEYERRSGRKIEVLPPLIPFRQPTLSKSALRPAYGYHTDDLVILALGSIKKIKGSDVLLEAFFRLGKETIERGRARLLFAGDGPLRGVLEGRTARSGYDHWVKFLGPVPHEKVGEVFRLSDIYVIPSQFEGAPLSLMEAMFNGLAIVGSDIESLRHFIHDGQNGQLFAAGDAGALAQRLQALLDDPALRLRLGSAAQSSFQDGYDFEEMVGRHIQICEDVVKVG